MREAEPSAPSSGYGQLVNFRHIWQLLLAWDGQMTEGRLRRGNQGTVSGTTGKSSPVSVGAAGCKNECLVLFAAAMLPLHSKSQPHENAGKTMGSKGEREKEGERFLMPGGEFI